MFCSGEVQPRGITIPVYNNSGRQTVGQVYDFKVRVNSVGFVFNSLFFSFFVFVFIFCSGALQTRGITIPVYNNTGRERIVCLGGIECKRCCSSSAVGVLVILFLLLVLEITKRGGGWGVGARKTKSSR